MSDSGHVYLLWTRVPSGDCNLVMHDTAEGEANCRRHTARVKTMASVEGPAPKFYSRFDLKEKKAK